MGFSPAACLNSFWLHSHLADGLIKIADFQKLKKKKNELLHFEYPANLSLTRP